jgi:hypothetical protein
MTIQDMLDHGIEIQGNITVKQWNDKKETYKILTETDIAIFKPEALDKEIKYMYSVDGVGLVIEVEPEE